MFALDGVTAEMDFSTKVLPPTPLFEISMLPQTLPPARLAARSYLQDSIRDRGLIQTRYLARCVQMLEAEKREREQAIAAIQQENHTLRTKLRGYNKSIKEIARVLKRILHTHRSNRNTANTSITASQIIQLYSTSSVYHDESSTDTDPFYLEAEEEEIVGCAGQNW